MSKFYITTSIPYANAAPHVGHALEFIQADVLARWHRQQGDNVFFLTGTDEHGTKIAKAAADAGISPQEFVDKTAVLFQELAKTLYISNDDFIRTSDQKRHWPSVNEVWQKLNANGDLYKKQYKGLYCSGCETFVVEKDLTDGKCAIHQKEPESVQEENYFFKLSKYSKEIERVLREGIIKIVPEHKKNELLRLIGEGLEDVSFSRPIEKLSWGVPVPSDDSQTMYVWADALTNYISVLGYPNGDTYKKYWPADVHVVGKDIVRFHALIWPAMLMSLGIALPKTLFVHGFITANGQKMSKSIGNVVDPLELIEKYGADAVRYFFLREIPPTEDGDFSYEKFEARYNADLAGGLGNLVARTLALTKKTTVSARESFQSKKLADVTDKAKEKRDQSLQDYRFNDALVAIWEIIHCADKYIEETRPWEEPENKKEIIGDVLLAILKITNLLEPFLPTTAHNIEKQVREREGKILFPRLG